MGEGEWTRCSPLAVLFFLSTLITGQVRNLGQLSGMVALVVFLASQGLVAMLAGALSLLGLFALVAALRHWCFRFRIDADRIRIRQGVFHRTEVVMHFDRVQSVVVEQPFFCRLLNLVSIGFDTAGSTTEEGRLPAVAPSFAAELRTRVGRMRRMEERRSNDAAPLAAAEPMRTTAPDAPVPLLRLRAGDMVRIGLADRSAIALVIATVVGWHTVDITDRGRERYRGWLDALAELFADWGLVEVGVGVAGGLLALLTVTIAAAFLRFHGFQMFAAEGDRSFRTERGLLSRTTAFAERAKIQQVTVYQGLVMRCLGGRFRLRAPVAALIVDAEISGQGDAAPGGLRVPMLTAEQLGDIAARVLGAERGDLPVVPRKTGFVAISPLYIRARTLAWGWFPAWSRWPRSTRFSASRASDAWRGRRSWGLWLGSFGGDGAIWRRRRGWLGAAAS